MSTSAEEVIELYVPGSKIEAFLANPPEGVEVTGDVHAGELKGYGIEATFHTTVNNNGTLQFRVTIIKKPWYATMGLIESKLKEHLSEDTDE